MLKRFQIRGFKSLHSAEVHFPQFSVLFGPNAAGKSNLLDALQALSRIGTSKTLSDALAAPIRGYPIESFTFPSGGLVELLTKQDHLRFGLEAELTANGTRATYLYRIEIEIQPVSGSLPVTDEYLAGLTKTGATKGEPSIELVEGQLHIRRKSKPAHPRQEPIFGNHSMLSDQRFSGPEYLAIEQCRSELAGWRIYYLDPRLAMREAHPPADVTDIGVVGDTIAPFLYRLRAEQPKSYDAVLRTLRSLIPSVEDLTVDLDKRRGTLDIQIKQEGIEYSSRIVSEGTLRVLALCCIAVNPWTSHLIAFEEPENGVHPRRVELIAKLLHSLAVDQGRQVIVTTHSPLFCEAILRLGREDSGSVGLFNVKRSAMGTDISEFKVTGPLFSATEIDRALPDESEDGLFEGLMLRGMLDE